MQKRIFAALLTLVMMLSLLPMNALAATSDPTTDGGAMTFTKTAAGPDNDGNYTITMTAQAKGQTTTTTTTAPMDIVLVLDQSGSMAYNFDGNETRVNTDRRQYAMKQAVNTFIGKVNEKYSAAADHRMAIVTFGTGAKTLAGWTDVNDSGKNTLAGAINGLPNSPSGATNVGAGMQTAQTLMNSAKAGADRQKVVIVFTDGVPTTESDFNTDVANTAISAAKSMKDSGVKVYTLGIFNGANPDEMYGASGFDTNSNGTVNSKWEEDNWGCFRVQISRKLTGLPGTAS